MVISYQCFGTTYRSHAQASRILAEFLNPEDGIDRFPQNVGKKLPLLAV